MNIVKPKINLCLNGYEFETYEKDSIQIHNDFFIYWQIYNYT